MNDKQEPLFKVILREERSTPRELSLLEAFVERNGDLVLDGYDLGPSVEELWGVSDDYEYQLRVRAEYVPRVLLELIKERFSHQLTFSTWLESKGIPSEYSDWV